MAKTSLIVIAYCSFESHVCWFNKETKFIGNFNATVAFHMFDLNKENSSLTFGFVISSKILIPA
jgi:hypothetical protein